MAKDHRQDKKSREYRQNHQNGRKVIVVNLDIAKESDPHEVRRGGNAHLAERKRYNSRVKEHVEASPVRTFRHSSSEAVCPSGGAAVVIQGWGGKYASAPPRPQKPDRAGKVHDPRIEQPYKRG